MDFSIAWQQLNRMGRSFMALLPNLLFGLLVFVAFVFAARGVRSLVERVTLHRQQSASLKILLSRLAYVATLILGILITVTIVVPSFTPAPPVPAPAAPAATTPEPPKPVKEQRGLKFLGDITRKLKGILIDDFHDKQY